MILLLAGELASHGAGCNTFRPVTAVDTRATRYFGLGTEDDWRFADVVPGPVLEVLRRDSAEFAGNALYDEELLQEAGVGDFSAYNISPGDPAPASAGTFDGAYERPETPTAPSPGGSTGLRGFRAPVARTRTNGSG